MLSRKVFPWRSLEIFDALKPTICVPYGCTSNISELYSNFLVLNKFWSTFYIHIIPESSTTGKKMKHFEQNKFTNIYTCKSLKEMRWDDRNFSRPQSDSLCWLWCFQWVGSENGYQVLLSTKIMFIKWVCTQKAHNLSEWWKCTGFTKVTKAK